MQDAYRHCEDWSDGGQGPFSGKPVRARRPPRALYSLYAFSLEITRVRRDCPRIPCGEIRLQWWRDAINGARSGEASASPVRRLLDATTRFLHFRPRNSSM